jgi:hypothetical protein
MITDKTKISIEEWEKEIITNLKLFRDFWEMNNKKDSNLFPMSINKGDWDEQFDFFCDNY